MTTICRATSAAPTFLPSFILNYIDGEQKSKKHNFIDGGVYINNPSLAAIEEVLSNKTDALYNKETDRKNNPIKLDDIFMLSLGTGITLKEVSEKEGKGWGQVGWALPVIEIMMQGNSQSVHKQVKTLLNDRYLRLDTEIPDKLSDMADSSDATAKGLIDAVNSKVLNNNSKVEELTSFIKRANL